MRTRKRNDFDQTILSAFQTSDHADDPRANPPLSHHKVDWTRLELSARIRSDRLFTESPSRSQGFATRVQRQRRFVDFSAKLILSPESFIPTSYPSSLSPTIASVPPGWRWNIRRGIDSPSTESKSRYRTKNSRGVVAQAAHGLSAVHAARPHPSRREPSNILLQRVGDRIVAKLADFGLSRLGDLSSQDTHTANLDGYAVLHESRTDPRSNQLQPGKRYL